MTMALAVMAKLVSDDIAEEARIETAYNWHRDPD